ncbi:c-type cytochrome, partial [Salmonella enterica]|uniref:c-type cytochrome n=1 Tax=Salmonella enterica TaxID=28901 RepID=UPI003FA7EC41
SHISMRRSLGVAVLVGTLHGVPAVAAPPSAEQLASPEWIAAGRAKFSATCAFCHGTEGDAGKHRPFREHIDWDPAQIHEVIREGRQRGANVMPSWKDSIDDEQIWQIVAYIKSLAGKPK